MPGFQDPVPTTSESSNAGNLDCIPVLAPECPSLTSFVNEFNDCVTFDWCENYYKCPSDGFFDETLNSCFCSNIEGEAELYCDATCERAVLKAYFTNFGEVLLEAGERSQIYDPSAFGDSVSLDGLACPVDKCLITAIPNDNGSQTATKEALPVFVDVWVKTHPNYVSPYAATRLLKATNATSDEHRHL